MYRFPRPFIAFILAAICGLSACNRHNATIVPKVQINKKSAEMGTPIEVTYSFSTKKEYVALQRDLTVFCHFLDPKRVIRFQDDHLPSIPTSQWRPNGNYHYTRTVFIPKNIPAGEYTLSLGIYSPEKGERFDLDAKTLDHRAYNMGTLLIEIPPQDITIQYAKGWYDPETIPSDVGEHWRWTKKEAVLKVRNPKADALLYFKADGNTEHFKDSPQMVTLKIGDNVIDTFPITSNMPFMKKYNVAKNLLGSGNMLELNVQVDRTFIPAEDKISSDTRELGIRVYEIYLGKASD
ncbi:MAG TPA: hypothetical protein VLR94_10700 [Acidobacteriota bacterium]|nr:hypothetical protein [Acidobacteriota bacterium]